MSETFSLPIDNLEYGAVVEKRVNYWREMLRKNIEVAPVKVFENPRRRGFWKVNGGADLCAAAKLEGLTELPCCLG